MARKERHLFTTISVKQARSFKRVDRRRRYPQTTPPKRCPPTTINVLAGCSAIRRASGWSSNAKNCFQIHFFEGTIYSISRSDVAFERGSERMFAGARIPSHPDSPRSRQGSKGCIESISVRSVLWECCVTRRHRLRSVPLILWLLLNRTSFL